MSSTSRVTGRTFRIHVAVLYNRLSVHLYAPMTSPAWKFRVSAGKGESCHGSVIQRQILPAIWLVTSAAIDHSDLICKLASMFIRMTGLARNVIEPIDACLYSINRPINMAFVTEYSLVRSHQRETRPAVIELHDMPARDVVTRGTAIFTDVLIKLPGVGIAVTNIAGKIRPCKSSCCFAGDAVLHMAAYTGNRLMRSFQRETRRSMCLRFEH
jgi:hypothetical protein